MRSLRQAKCSAEPTQDSKSTASFVVDTIQKRIKYYDEKSLTSGWASFESGPCCEKCAMRIEHFTGRADALKAIVGCRNPFQLDSICQCHIPVRRAAIYAITNALSQLVSILGDNAEEFRYSGEVRANTTLPSELAPAKNKEVT